MNITHVTQNIIQNLAKNTHYTVLNCSEIWGVLCNLNDSDPFEHLHLKFIKEVLGVNCKTSNDACRAELARLPLKARIQCSVINFLDHIYSSEDTLLYKAFVATKNSNSWVKNTKKRLNNLGYSYIFDKKSTIKNHINNLKQRITDQCLQNQNSIISPSSKLEFFKTVYKMGQRPSYVDNLIDIKQRAAIAKIRTSSHTLMIEKGRHKNIPISERICQVCNSGHIENEEHFLLHCKDFEQERQLFVNKINTSYPSFVNSSPRIKIIFLLNNKSNKILRMSSSFILNCFRKRGTHTQE